MGYVDWDPAYDTGIPGIDYEHHRLVELLNEIHELILSRAEPRKVAGVLADFHTLATSHFALEEKIMRAEKHPRFEERRATHYRLLDQARDIMDAFDTGSYRLGEALPATLKQWLVEAMELDVRLFAEIKETNLRNWGLRRA